MKLNGNMKDKQGDSVTYFLKAEETYATKNTGKTEVPREVKIKDNQIREMIMWARFQRNQLEMRFY